MAKRVIHRILLCWFGIAVAFLGVTATARAVEPGLPHMDLPQTRDLITPANAEPIPIDQALQRRLVVSGRKARKVILLIADGMSAAAIKVAREVMGGHQGGMAIDRFPVVARVMTTASDCTVTDSAAAASTMANGRPTANGQIGVGASGRPRISLFEFARDQGFRVGLVTDTRITHATPAGFVAHVVGREDENEIAKQLVDSRFHVLLGGGRRYFAPTTRQERWAPKDDLLSRAAKAGFKVVGTRAQLATVCREGADRVLGLFSSSMMPFSFEAANADVPTLTEMALRAIDILERGESKGFLLMVEAGKIDFTAHAHDAAELVAQMRVFDDTARALLEYVRRHPDALLVCVPDHGTGGITVTDEFEPNRFRLQATSSIYLARQINGRPEAVRPVLTHPALAPLNIGSDEIDALVPHAKDDKLDGRIGTLLFGKLGLTFIDPDRQRRLSTGGHIGDDLFLHAVGRHQDLFQGVLRQWEIPARIAAAVGLPFVPSSE